MAIAAALLLAGCGSWSGPEDGATAAGAAASRVPPIDRAAPDRYETATFGLG